MTSTLRRWLVRKWLTVIGKDEVMRAYQVCFSNLHGRVLLQNWLDTIYCHTYEGSDVVMLAYHNGRRSVIQEILENIDFAENPSKYEVLVETMEPQNASR